MEHFKAIYFAHPFILFVANNKVSRLTGVCGDTRMLLTCTCSAAFILLDKTSYGDLIRGKAPKGMPACVVRYSVFVSCLENWRFHGFLDAN